MGLLEEARGKLLKLLDSRGIDRQRALLVRPLQPDEAIGKDASQDFVIKKGKERVIEATFAGARGQAFTDQPSAWSGTVEDLVRLDLSRVTNRAVVVAGLNAILRYLGGARGTVHCLNEDPSRCGEAMVAELERRFGKKRVGLIGLQPAILSALVKRFGADAVRVLDLNADNIGISKYGVPIWDGERDLARVVEWCEVGLATGSSVVNGTIDEIKARFGTAGKPLIFFGNTVAGVAVLLDLERICPFGQ
ncbi:MAG: DUF364 domain-containing protein [Candidatus Abyssubacteria bacterium]